MSLEDAGRHRLDGVAVADVAQLDLGADLVRDRAQPVLTPCDEDAPPAFLGEQPGDRLADPGRGSRDDRDLLAGHGGNLVNARPRVRIGSPDMPNRFEGKQALVLGVANRRSIAWAIAERLAAEGAQLAFTYQGERIEKNVRDLAATVDTKLVTPCDVRSDDDLDRVFAEAAEAFGGGLDVLVHSVAFAAAEDLEGRFTDTPRDRFWMAVDISAYSLVACARRAEPLMEARDGGSIVTMTYLGGVRAVPHYNVMGVAKATLDASMRYLAWDLGQKEIRINAISAGPVRTLAARSIAGFTTMEEMFEQRAPLHRAIDAADCGAAAAYLLSDDARNVSGTTLYVDAGYHAMGM